MNEAALGTAELQPREFDGLRRVIRKIAGIDLRDSKKHLVAGRLQRRLRELGLSTFSDYLRLVDDETNAEEHEAFINCITTNKTSFFREPHHFELLQKTIVPEIVARVRTGGLRRIRIWSAGCSTGQEPWTIAMTLAEALGSFVGWDVRILASDLDTSVLERAERAVYDEQELEDVSLSLRDRHFDPVAGGYRVRGPLRSLVTFRRINLVAPPTWNIRTRFDVIFCRNVAIYFNRQTQDAVFTELASLLEPTGYLMSGHSENLHWLPHVLRPLGNTVHVPAARGRPGPRRTGLRTALGTAPGTTHATAPQATPAASPEKDRPEVAIAVGGVSASASGARIRTTLGSGVAVCLHDPEARIGGVNHFLLSEDTSGSYGPSSLGVHAMELLINAMMKLGGDRRRFVAKVFGASEQPGSITRSPIAQKNAEFTLRFLKEEGIPVLAKKLGDPSSLSLLFDTTDGRAFVRTLDKAAPPSPPSNPSLTIGLDEDITFFGEP